MIHSPLKSIGGKYASVKRLLDAFPRPDDYDYYVEPFCGACHVILGKPPYGHKEIINDLDDCITNFWQQMIVNASAVKELVLAYPYSIRLYYDFYHSLYGSRKHQIEPDKTLTATEKAFRYYYILRSNMTGYVRSSPPAWTTLHVDSMKNITEVFEAVQQRLSRVAIDSRDGIATIERYSKLNGRVFFFCDPPYFDREWYYPASRDGFDHEKLASVLNRSQHRVALSYYPHDEIDRLYPDWHRVTWTQHKPSNVGTNKESLDIATEMLLTNYEPPRIQRSLWNSETA